MPKQGSPARRRWLKPLCNQRGQGLAELGLTVALFTCLCMGVMEIGRTWLILNMITQAAREGARIGALVSAANRGTGTSLGLFDTTAKTSITNAVKSEIGGVLDATTISGLTITVSQSPSTGGVVAPPTIPTVTVSVSGNVSYMFNILATQFAVNRSVSFRDEGR